MFSGMLSFVVSLAISIATGVYLIVIVVYTLFTSHSFSDKRIVAHLVSTGLVFILSVVVLLLAQYSKFTGGIDKTLPLWSVLILSVWMGLTWYLGVRQDAYIIGGIILTYAIAMSLYLFLT